jgi:hypothetical protein
MDVYCSSCGEPWDTYHLRCDEIFETGISYEAAQAWRELPYAEQLSEHYREIFRAAGWEFGRTIINVIRCPACPKDAKPDEEKSAAKAALEDVLGDDLDGLAAAFEDYQL